MTPAASGRGPVTINEVAELANVSIATVSRALRGFDNVAPTTAARVAEAAEKLGYTSNQHAARLRSGVSRAIMIVVPALSGWYCPEVMAGAEAVLSDAGYDTLVTVADTGEEFARLVEAIQPARARVDGLIIVEQTLTHDRVEHLKSWRFPAAVVGQFIPGLPSVGIDDTKVGATAAAHLLELGHERIGIISGQGHRSGEMSSSALRLRGFEEALARAGRALPESSMATSDFTIGGAMHAAASLFAQPEPPTAVFCMSDFIAIGAMRTLRDLGFAVPEDVSLIGVDDHEIAGLMDLTTIRQPVGELGAIAAHAVLESLDGTPAPDHQQLHSELVIRKTTVAVG